MERVWTAFRAKRSWTAIALCVGLWQPATADSPIPTAVFDFELIDTSLEGEVSGQRADEQRRLKLISDQLRRQLSESGRFRPHAGRSRRCRTARRGSPSSAGLGGSWSSRGNVSFSPQRPAPSFGPQHGRK